jgi:hypothetical protein
MSPAPLIVADDDQRRHRGVHHLDKTGKTLVIMLMGTGKVTVTPNGREPSEWHAPTTQFVVMAVDEDAFPITIEAPGVAHQHPVVVEPVIYYPPAALPMMVGVSYGGETFIVSASRFVLDLNIRGGFDVVSEAL